MAKAESLTVESVSIHLQQYGSDTDAEAALDSSQMTEALQQLKSSWMQW
jgi:hypothetical protein